MTFLFAFTLIPASAQDDESVGPLEDISQLEGIEAGIARTWSIDFAALAEITPEAGSTPESDSFDPFAGLEGLYFMTGQVMKFDNNEHAEAAFELYRDNGVEEIEASVEEGAGELEISEEEIDGLGDQAHAFTVFGADETFEGYFRFVFAREDEYVFAVISVATTEDAASVGDSVLELIVDDGEMSGDDEEFVSDGTSTGGLWGFFPDNDHEVFGDLIPATDEILFPVPDETG
jgi:hypothetical protein